MAPPTQRIFFSLIILLAALSVIFSLTRGSVVIPLEQIYQWHANPILEIRLNRTVSAFVCGGLLTLAGIIMQLLLENSLADPYVLGISGGASLGTLIFMLLGINTQWLVIGAWSGSLCSMLVIVLLAKKHAWQTNNMLLIGIALASVTSSLLTLLLLLSSSTTSHNVLYWLTGDLNNADFPKTGCIVLIMGFILCYILAPGMNILARGELEARSLGLPTKHFKIALFLLSSLFTATAVSIAGCIGFIGLIIPHLSRRLIGFDHCRLIPAASLIGASLLTIADTFARTIIAPMQLPVGILLVLIGVPVFISLLPR